MLYIIFSCFFMILYDLGVRRTNAIEPETIGEDVQTVLQAATEQCKQGQTVAGWGR